MAVAAIVLKDHDELIRRDVELMEHNKGKTSKAREGEEAAARPTVAELLVTPLQDGHMMNVAVKIAEDDGSVTDYTIETNAVAKPLRIELKHLQEVVVRVKVTGLVGYDADQAAVVAIPIGEVPPIPASKGEEAHKTKDATHTAKK